MIKKRMTGILTALLVLAAAVGFMPQIGTTAYAASGDPAISLGTDAITKNAGSDQAQKVWYAGDSWYVIADGEKSFDWKGESFSLYRADTITLFHESMDEKCLFSDLPDTNIDSIKYEKSIVKSQIDSWYNGENAKFSQDERKAVIKRTLENSLELAGVDITPNTDKILGDQPVDAYLWPLSYYENRALPESLRARFDFFTLTSINPIWFRVPFQGSSAYKMNISDGSVVSSNTKEYPVRPAFFLDPDSVLLVSAAENGKTSGDVGADALTEVGNNTNSEWKLTLLDDGTGSLDGHKDFTVANDRVAYDSETGMITIPYSGARTGTGEYISAIIEDNSGEVKYYGRIAEAYDAADAAVEISIGDKLGSGDTLYVFNEQYNNDKMTDYASSLKEIKIPELISYKVTFRVIGGSWNDGSTADKTVTLSRYDNEDKALVLQDEDIPAVGNKPDANYKEGSWDVTPSTDKVITEDKTYTYTYAAKEPLPTPEPAKVSGVLLAKITAKGNNSLVLEWTKMNGVDGYDVFFIKCGKGVPKKVKTIEGNETFKWKNTGLKKKAAYKALVKAYVMKDGKKIYVKSSPTVHAYTSGGTKNYTNSKSVTVRKTKVTLKKGKIYKIKASVKKLQKGKKLMPKSHEAKLRYLSTDTNVATVSKSGKITAKSKGSCKVYVLAVNGARKAVAVTVK